MAANPRPFCGDFNCRLINNEYFLMLWITFVFTERKADLNPISKVNTWNSGNHRHASTLTLVCSHFLVGTVIIKKYRSVQQFSEILILF